MKKWKIYATISLCLLFVSFESAASMENTTLPSPLNFWFLMLSFLTGVGSVIAGAGAIVEWETSGP